MVSAKARLFQVTRNVLKYRLLRDPSIRSDRLGREHMADLAVRFAKNNHVGGSYLEFGVWRGSTFSQFYHALRRHRLPLRMYAFDSFEGLPAPRELETLSGYEPFRKGQFTCSEGDFHREMSARGVPSHAYTVVAGFYEDTLTETLHDTLGLEPAALVWIDSVLYESARAVLAFIGPLLQDGTLLMFNDFYRFKGSPDLGERRAFTEFLAASPRIRVTDYAKFSSVGQAFIVHVTTALRTQDA